METMDTLKPELTLDLSVDESSPAEMTQALTSIQVSDPEFLRRQRFTEAEQQQITEFAQKIDMTNTDLILQYGTGAQKKLSDFSDTALASVRNKDMGEMGELLANLVTEIRSSTQEEKGIKGFFQRGQNKIEAMRARYAKSEENIDRIAEKLQDHQVTLMKDIALLDKLYERNELYFKELSMYIAAGKQRLETAKTVDLVAAQNKARETQLPEDAQAAEDLASMIARFEKKIYDLELTRTICLQMAPQIRMVQSNDTLMSEKIQSSLVNSLPLWKSQMVLALGVYHSQEAAKAQQLVADATNEMLKKNADTLKQATIDSAREYERGIVDIETLQHTNEQLISTIDEVIQIQKEGREKRQAAEQELVKIEDELREKLIESSTKAN